MMFRAVCFTAFVLTVGILVSSSPQRSLAYEEPTPIEPKEKRALFNGKDLTGFYIYMSDTKYEDPRRIFTVESNVDGAPAIHVSGDGLGGLLTKEAFKNYHLTVEYRWGTKTWRQRVKAARDSGVLVHCQGPDGGYGGIWPSCIEFQIIEGGTGDLLVVSGKDAKIPPSVIAEIEKDRDGEMVWKRGGMKQLVKKGRVNWYGRDVDWKDVVGFRGKNDVESPGQEWTKLECIAEGDHLTYLVNGKVVNEAFEVMPSSGKLCFQTELAEIYFRKIEIGPIRKK
jgi:hypothetical protein